MPVDQSQHPLPNTIMIHTIYFALRQHQRDGLIEIPSTAWRTLKDAIRKEWRGSVDVERFEGHFSWAIPIEVASKAPFYLLTVRGQDMSAAQAMDVVIPITREIAQGHLQPYMFQR